MNKAVRSVLAVLAGSIVINITAGGCAFLLRLAMPAAFTDDGQTANGGMFLIMLGYTSVFSVLGGYITARLSASAPMAHVLALAALQGIGSLAAASQLSGAVPQWFQLLIVMVPIPAIMLGGKMRRTPA